MKKRWILCMMLLMLTGMFAHAHAAAASGDTAPLRIVATIFPAYDWVNQVLGDRTDLAEVTLLLDNGVDLHSYQPTVDDILKVSTCDLFVYVGGESDEWVKDVLSEAANKNLIVINLLDELGDAAKEEEVVEGMEAEPEEDEAHGADDAGNGDEAEGDAEEIEYDEHVWLSLRNASVLCERIADAIAEIDPSNADVYRENVASYREKLSALDEAYRQAVEEGAVKTLLFGDRFPFRYLTDDYGLDYYAAFVGCSAETEASFETIVFLAKKVDELNLKAIMTIEGENHRIAQTIRDNTAAKDQQILIMDSMQSATSQDVQNGSTYLSIMEGNLEVLKEALR